MSQKYRESIFALIEVVKVHPWSAPHWNRLSQCYDKISPNQHQKSIACSCRALELYKSVNKTVGSFVKDSHDQSISVLKAKLSDVPESELTRITNIMTKDIFHRKKDDNEEVVEDFEDLGASARIKRIENSYKDDIDIKVGGDDNIDVVINNFDKQWFSDL